MSLLLYNGIINGEEQYEWILINGNKIEALGRGNPPSAARKINLKGKFLMPGFCDSHTHLSNIAVMHAYLNLTGKERNEVLSLVKMECGRRKIIIGRGWDESFWNEKKYLSKEELDSVCEKPTLLIREDGHIAVLIPLSLKNSL